MCNTPELWKNHSHSSRPFKTFPSCLSQTNDHWADISLDKIIFHLSRPMSRTTWAAAVLSEIGRFPQQNKHKNTLLWVPVRKSILSCAESTGWGFIFVKTSGCCGITRFTSNLLVCCPIPINNAILLEDNLCSTLLLMKWTRDCLANDTLVKQEQSINQSTTGLVPTCWLLHHVLLTISIITSSSDRSFVEVPSTLNQYYQHRERLTGQSQQLGSSRRLRCDVGFARFTDLLVVFSSLYSHCLQSFLKQSVSPCCVKQPHTKKKKWKCVYIYVCCSPELAAEK